MKLEDAARGRTDEDDGVVRARRGSITLYKERLYRVRPRVERQEVGVEHGAKGERVVERLRERRALERERAHTPVQKEALGAAREVQEADAPNETPAHGLPQGLEDAAGGEPGEGRGSDEE
jgi:hypothetical protein